VPACLPRPPALPALAASDGAFLPNAGEALPASHGRWVLRFAPLQHLHGSSPLPASAVAHLELHWHPWLLPQAPLGPQPRMGAEPWHGWGRSQLCPILLPSPCSAPSCSCPAPEPLLCPVLLPSPCSAPSCSRAPALPCPAPILLPSPCSALAAPGRLPRSPGAVSLSRWDVCADFWLCQIRVVTSVLAFINRSSGPLWPFRSAFASSLFFPAGNCIQGLPGQRDPR